MPAPAAFVKKGINKSVDKQSLVPVAFEHIAGATLERVYADGSTLAAVMSPGPHAVAMAQFPNVDSAETEVPNLA